MDSHVFLAQVDGCSYRCSPILDDSAFDRLMDMMQWKMPYRLRAFHCSNPKWVAENPVLKTVPELPVDIEHILASSPPQPMRLKDKQRQQTLAVRRKCGDYVLTDTEDGYGRLYYVDGITSSLVTRLEAAPLRSRRQVPTLTGTTGTTRDRSSTSFPSVCASPANLSRWALRWRGYQRPATRWTARPWRLTAAVPMCGMRMCAAASMPVPFVSGARWGTAGS